MRSLLREEGLDDQIEIDSAGTGGWHAGDPPDARATAAAARRGIVLDGAARQVRPSDFEEYDLLLAADRENLADLRHIAPVGTQDKIRLLRSYDPEAHGDLDVPDPYYGGRDGFEHVLDMLERSCDALVAELRRTLTT